MRSGGEVLFFKLTRPEKYATLGVGQLFGVCSTSLKNGCGQHFGRSCGRHRTIAKGSDMGIGLGKPNSTMDHKGAPLVEAC